MTDMFGGAPPPAPAPPTPLPPPPMPDPMSPDALAAKRKAMTAANAGGRQSTTLTTMAQRGAGTLAGSAGGTGGSGTYAGAKTGTT